MDNPLANYANDALEMGLAIAEELENPTGGPVMLDLYADAVLFELTARPDSQRVALERFITFAESELDLTTPQHLLERGRFDLALLLQREGEHDLAVRQCERIVLDHPDGRFPAAALAMSGGILAEQQRWEEARQAYERLLLQYPDHLFADDIREQLRGLP
jgi:tetratricopeptide (TPR) repeat protein